MDVYVKNQAVPRKARNGRVYGKGGGSSFVSSSTSTAESPFIITAEKVTCDRDFHVIGNISASEEVIAWVAGAVTSDVLSALSAVAPLYKPTGSSVGIKIKSTQFEVNANNELQIKTGTPNGIAELDSSGVVKSSQLPSFVDDVIDGQLINSTTFNALQTPYNPGGTVTPSGGKIYLDIYTNMTYRWSGTIFVATNSQIALGETSSTAYRGDRGKIAYDHSQTSHNYAPAITGLTTNYLPKWNGSQLVNSGIEYEDQGGGVTVYYIGGSGGRVRMAQANSKNYLQSSNGTKNGSLPMVFSGINGDPTSFEYMGRVVIIPPLNNSDYGFHIAGAYGGANKIALIGQNGVSNGLTVSYNGTSMVYEMLDGNLSVGGNITATGEVTAYSDVRLKSNIQPLELRGELNPVTYEKDGKQSIGFLAQQVKEVYPELVLGDEETEMLSLNYQQLTAVLYAEIIDLKKKIKKLEKE